MNPWYAMGALAVGAVMLGSKKALAYVRGKPVHISIAPLLTRAVDGSTVYLREDAAKAWNLLSRAAANDGLAPKPSGKRAAFRTMEQQAELIGELGSYRDDPDGLAARAGYSPHQSGYALDIDGVNPWAASYNAELRAWMLRHAPTYGWHNVGASFSKPEPWHWEYQA